MSAPASSMAPRLRKARQVLGEHLVFEDATERDAPFIHALRTDPVRARFLSAVAPQLQAQIEWMRRYRDDDSQAYFVISDAASREPWGTVRLYGARADSFSWGSWLLKPGLAPHCGIESALMVYHYAGQLGFRSAFFEVIQANTSVWRFHERFGARRIGSGNGHFQYLLDPPAIAASLRKYQRYLPHGIRIDSLS